MTLCNSSAKIRAFTLLEILVAMAVLSIMMVFLFNLVAQVIRAWDGGARRVEAAQAARVGVDTMARELQNAFGGSNVVTNVGPQGVTNVIPFFATNSGSALWGLPTPFKPAPDSGQIFVAAPVSGDANVLAELGYMSVYVTGVSAAQPGYHNLRGYRYFLMRHAPGGTNANFFFRGSASTNWIEETGGGVQTGRRAALIPNCYQLKVSFATNNGDGVLQFVDSWTNQSAIPAGVLVVAKVMDEKTAARVQQLQSNGLTAADVSLGTQTELGRIVREGTIEVRRFVPFVNMQR